MRKSSRSDIDPFIVMDVMEAARQAESEGRQIIHMEVGQPSTPAPGKARDALAERLSSDAMGYTVALGLPALRAKISALYGARHDIDLDPSRVIVTAGASGAFLLAFSALFDSDARVGVTEPGYPSYKQILRALGMAPVGIQTRAEDRFQPTPEILPDDLDGLIIASPGNPAGTQLGRDQLCAIVEHALTNNISLISDEIYHGLHYDTPAETALAFSDDLYVINSFSKYFSMTGWRVGWMVVPTDHARIVERIAQNMFICPPHASQIAALAAMDCTDELEGHIATYATNRQIMIDGLKAAGFTRFAPPDGAFYVYVDVSDFTHDSLGFCKDLLDRAQIAVTPGLDFDTQRGHRTIRFSYARATTDIQEGMHRLHRFMVQEGHI